ncbi:hypothetical protein L9F63_026859, partial [Diploptera punctata]
ETSVVFSTARVGQRDVLSVKKGKVVDSCGNENPVMGKIGLCTPLSRSIFPRSVFQGSRAFAADRRH